jgi:hypothetical protein
MFFSAHRLGFCATRFTSPPETIYPRQSAVVQNGIADTYIASIENKTLMPMVLVGILLWLSQKYEYT